MSGAASTRRILAETVNDLGTSALDITDLLPDEVKAAICARLDAFDVESNARAPEVMAEWRARDRQRASQRAARPNNVYLMFSNGAYKVGVSQSVEVRRAQLSTASGHPVEIVATWPMDSERALQVERAVHEHFAAKRMNGEWFALTKHDIATIAIMAGGLP